ncbi:MAG TPA: phage holin family protein [Candidatus Limnocylindria bacterium]
MNLLIQLLINSAALYVAQLLIEGLDFDFSQPDAWWQFLLVAFIFGLVNTFLKPILRLLTLPITMVTLGLFLVVLNAVLLWLTGVISEQLALGLEIDGFIPALLGAIVISIVSLVLSTVLGMGRKAV